MSLPPNTCHVYDIPAPILCTHAVLYIPVKTGIRPIDDFTRQAMLDGVVMDVIDMLYKVALVAQHMLPVAMLPNVFQSCMLAEPRLDQSPARHEVGIVFRQSPDAMQVIGQDDDGVDSEWPYMDSSSFANIPSLTFRYDCSRIFGL